MNFKILQNLYLLRGDWSFMVSGISGNMFYCFIHILPSLFVYVQMSLVHKCTLQSHVQVSVEDILLKGGSQGDRRSVKLLQMISEMLHKGLLKDK